MMFDKKIIETLKGGGVGVLPTDTLYGLVGSALNKKAVERIYKLKKRDPQKPMIVLIADTKNLTLFGVRHVSDTCLTPFWPGKVSVILPCPSKKFFYLHRGTKTLAFRLPKPKWLRDLLKKTGPLVAPSANPEGMKPAQNIKEARGYFGENVDFYIDAGKLSGKPSTLIKIESKKMAVLRRGAVNQKELSSFR